MRAEARALLSSLAWGAEKAEFDTADFARLMSFDADLKARGFNPGTTADLVVAALFASGLAEKIGSGRNP